MNNRYKGITDDISDIEKDISSRTYIGSDKNNTECTIKPCRQILLMRYPV